MSLGDFIRLAIPGRRLCYLVVLSAACCVQLTSNRLMGSVRDLNDGTASRFLAALANAAITDYRYDDGIELLRRAIQCNPDDAGRNYDPTMILESKPDFRRHGLLQLKHMLADRP